MQLPGALRSLPSRLRKVTAPQALQRLGRLLDQPGTAGRVGGRTSMPNRSQAWRNVGCGLPKARAAALAGVIRNSLYL